MGDRGNIKFVYENKKEIFFYTHWKGTELPAILQSALQRGKGRWDDESYLARIIFSEMVKDEVLEETGYGITPCIYDNEHDILTVIPKHRFVCIEDENGNRKKLFTFQEYLDCNPSDYFDR